LNRVLVLLLPLLFLSESVHSQVGGAGNQGQNPDAFQSAFDLNSSRIGQSRDSGSSRGRGRGGFFGTAGASRYSLTGWRALRAARVSQRAPGNIRLGQVDISFDAGFSTRFDSNVNTSNDNPVADFIFQPSFDIDLRWAVTAFNELSFNIGLQYEKYLRSVDRDRSGLNLAPDTELAWRVFVGDFLFTVYERPTTTQDGGEDSGLTNVGSFRLFENNAGIIGLWDLNDVLLSAGFDRGDVFSLNDNFTEQDRYVHALFTSAALRLTATDLAGVRAVVSQTRYREDIQNDFDYYEFGLFVESTLSPYTSVRLAGGIQHFEFLPTGTPITEQEFLAQQEAASATGDEITNVSGTLGGGNFTGPFFLFELSNRLNRYMTHGVSFGVEASASSFSNFRETYFVDYSLNWQWNQRTNFNFGILLEHVNVSGGAQSDFDQFQLRLGLSRRLSESLSLSLDYLGQVQAAETSVQSYTRSVFEIGLNYRF